MEFKRNYLTSEEMNFIVSEVIKIDNALDREVVMTSLVAQILTDDFKDYDNCSDIYDKIIESCDGNIYDEFIKINNLYILESCIEEELGVNATVRHFIEDLSEKIDKYAQNVSNENLEKIIEEFKKISEENNI